MPTLPIALAPLTDVPRIDASIMQSLDADLDAYPSASFAALLVATAGEFDQAELSTHLHFSGDDAFATPETADRKSGADPETQASPPPGPTIAHAQHARTGEESEAEADAGFPQASVEHMVLSGAVKPLPQSLNMEPERVPISETLSVDRGRTLESTEKNSSPLASEITPRAKLPIPKPAVTRASQRVGTPNLVARISGDKNVKELPALPLDLEDTPTSATVTQEVATVVLPPVSAATKIIVVDEQTIVTLRASRIPQAEIQETVPQAPSVATVQKPETAANRASLSPALIERTPMQLGRRVDTIRSHLPEYQAPRSLVPAIADAGNRFRVDAADYSRYTGQVDGDQDDQQYQFSRLPIQTPARSTAHVLVDVPDRVPIAPDATRQIPGNNQHDSITRFEGFERPLDNRVLPSMSSADAASTTVSTAPQTNDGTDAVEINPQSDSRRELPERMPVRSPDIHAPRFFEDPAHNIEVSGERTVSDIASGAATTHRTLLGQGAAVLGGSVLNADGLGPEASPMVQETSRTGHVSDQLAAKLVTHARIQSEAMHSEFELQLDPPELGRVTVRLLDSEEGLKARIIVAHETTLHLVERDLPALREALSGSGVDVREFDVSYQQEDGSDQHERWERALSTAVETTESMAPEANQDTCRPLANPWKVNLTV